MTSAQHSPQERLGKHFLKRLRRRLEADAISGAVEAGLLVDEPHMIGGAEVRKFAAHPTLIGKPEAAVDLAIRRLGSARANTGSNDDIVFEFDDDGSGVGGDGVLLSSSKRKQSLPANRSVTPDTGIARGADHRRLTEMLLRAVRKSAGRPRAAEVATLLMLARSLTENGATLEGALECLRLGQPIVTIVGSVVGFEQCFLDLLRDGLVLPGEVASSNGYELHRGHTVPYTNRGSARWQILTFPGAKFDPDSLDRADASVGRAALHDFPILGVAEEADRLPERLQTAAQLRLTCGPLDMKLIRDVIDAVLGEEPGRCICEAHCSVLSLSDLAIAIRPGVTVAHAMDVLEQLAVAKRKFLEAGQDGDGTASRSHKTHTSNRTPVSGRGDPGSGSEVIQPAPLTGRVDDAFIARVETLSGYGEATDWALALKEDLELWRADALGWDEMSPKLLLSGPPGTGKTIFAKALCNTLQIPLIVTSVSTWLEPSHLGDVLRRMKAAFAEAEAQNPAILFIDEIDGIGKRQDPTFEYAEYWNSIVNQALTLLDGAIKTSGIVVVGATNNPNAIDAALLRSGRLERHIAIPRPDTEALIGILRHHLKGDLDAVLASAPRRMLGDAQTARLRHQPQPASYELGELAPGQNSTTHQLSSVSQGGSGNGEI